MDVPPVRSQGRLDWPMTMAGRVGTEYRSVHMFERDIYVCIWSLHKHTYSNTLLVLFWINCYQIINKKKSFLKFYLHLFLLQHSSILCVVPNFWPMLFTYFLNNFFLTCLIKQVYWQQIQSLFVLLRKSLFSFTSVKFSLVTQSCPTLCHPMDCSMPGLPAHHQLPKFTQTHVHWVGDAIQPSHRLSSPSPPALNLSEHQGLFKWVSSSHQVAKVLEFQLQHQSFYRIKLQE